MKRINIKTGSAQYSVYLERDLLRGAGKLIAKLIPGKSRRCFVITVAPVFALWDEKLKQSLAKAKLQFEVIESADGERSKTLASLEQLAEKMSARGADRDSIVIAFGGGVIGDLAGMLASVYMRGVPLVQIPTTLLAQVDASVGGKTGVNLRNGKNLIGTFHQPKAVIIDPNLLATLPERELRAGLFEVIKCGVIRDRKLLEFTERERDALLHRDPGALEHVIEACVRIKAAVVESDERESDLRRILNFGHTVGHALEADTGYRYFLHGEAVGWGMAAAAMIGVAVRKTPPELAQRIVSTVLSYSPIPAVNSRSEDIVRLVRGDKKASGGKVHFILPIAPGKVIISNRVPDDVVAHAVEQLRVLSRD